MQLASSVLVCGSMKLSSGNQSIKQTETEHFGQKCRNAVENSLDVEGPYGSRKATFSFQC